MMAETTGLPFEKKAIIPIDPRTKIFLTVTVSTIMVAGGTGGIMTVIRPCLMAFPMCLLLLSKRWKSVLKFSAMYAVLFALELTVLPLLTGTWNFVLGAAIGIYTHMLPGFIMGYYLIESTTVSEFVAAMERYISRKRSLFRCLWSFAFSHDQEEYAAIGDAMKMRGISTLRSPIKMLEYRVVPLMISIANIGEELSAAALTRGLGAPTKRTNICNIGFGALDVIFVAASLACWIGFVI